jgi:hypothetical protein
MGSRVEQGGLEGSGNAQILADYALSDQGSGHAGLADSKRRTRTGWKGVRPDPVPDPIKFFPAN